MFYFEDTGEDIFYDDDYYIETSTSNKTILKDLVAPIVDEKLNDPKIDREFKNLIGDFINRNIDKLSTSGPVYMIPFTDIEKGRYFDLFGIDYEIKKVGSRQEFIVPEIKNHSREVATNLGGESAKFKLLMGNPTLVLFYFCIRHYSMKKDEKGLNSAIAIYTLAAYPSTFSKYFEFGTNEAIMQYTIDNLTDKFRIKKEKHIFGALTTTSMNSYAFHKNDFPTATDKQVVAFIQRIKNDQNSMLKKISNQYYNNYYNGRYIVTKNSNYDDDTPIVDDVSNSTTDVMNITVKVTLPIISNGVDIVLAEAAAKMAGIGISDCRFYLTKIIVDKNIHDVQKFISSLLFVYLYDGHRTAREINSSHFLAWSASLFKKTNSKNANIGRINDLLSKWAEDSGIYNKFKREASRINYKKAIFFYIVLSIQKNNK